MLVVPKSGGIMAAGRCHSRASGNPVTTSPASQVPQGLLDRPVKPGDDKVLKPQSAVTKSHNSFMLRTMTVTATSTASAVTQ